MLKNHYNKNDNTPPSSGNSNESDDSKEDENQGTLTLDATCAPANIRYTQDISLLNDASVGICKYHFNQQTLTKPI